MNSYTCEQVLPMPHGNEVQPNRGVRIQNLKQKRSTYAEGTNEYVCNYDGYMQKLSYGVDGNVDWSHILEGVTILLTSKISREGFN